MSEITDRILVEKYRPGTFDELILEKKTEILKYLNNPKTIPSFIFFSNKPGTGKTSTAKLIAKILDSDILMINSSDDRGIDTIRERVRAFASSRSSNGNKRCIFMDEGDGLTAAAQDSLRNLMETYSDNCFFIITCNRLNKITEPIQSRCVVINFERPDRAEILIHLEEVCTKEQIKFTTEGLERILKFYYPDIRSMIKLLNECKITGRQPDIAEVEFDEFWKQIKAKNISLVYQKAYDETFDVDAFVIWLFQYLFEKGKPEITTYSKIMYHLADYEKSSLLGVNREIVFVYNMLEIMKLL